MWIIALVAVVLLVGGCAGPQPTLAPSPKLQEVGPEQAQRDVLECTSEADRTVPVSEAERAAQESAAIPGRIAGGTNLPSSPNPVTGGGSGGFIPGPPRPTSPGPTVTPVWRAAVERCLAGRGYTVSGWK